MNLNDYAEVCHAANIKWWQNPETGEPIKRNKGELIALMHSEISECDDGECEQLMDDKLPHREMGEVECVDAIIRIFDYAAGFNYDLNSAALKVGLSEFENLDHIADCVMPLDTTLKVCERGISVIHSKLSNLLEHERKGRQSEAAEALVTCIVYIVTYAGVQGYTDLQGAFEEKMRYNATRADHKHEARKIAGGKQF